MSEKKPVSKKGSPHSLIHSKCSLGVIITNSGETHAIEKDPFPLITLAESPETHNKMLLSLLSPGKNLKFGVH